jgi:hypothetical protein
MSCTLLRLAGKFEPPTVAAVYKSRSGVKKVYEMGIDAEWLLEPASAIVAMLRDGHGRAFRQLAMPEERLMSVVIRICEWHIERRIAILEEEKLALSRTIEDAALAPMDGDDYTDAASDADSCGEGGIEESLDDVPDLVAASETEDEMDDEAVKRVGVAALEVLLDQDMQEPFPARPRGCKDRYSAYSAHSVRSSAGSTQEWVSVQPEEL